MKKLGFSLIELLITLAIVCILAAIAYPLYSHHIIKTRRAHATVALMSLANKLEQYYILHQSYEGATLNELNIKANTEKSFYRLQINSATATNYIIAAVPLAAQTKDIECGTLIYDQAGEKSITGNGTIASCW